MYKEHTPLNPDILQRYGIQPCEIFKGVQCKECGFLPMKRLQGNWNCPHCFTSSKTAHLKALHDYYLLFGNSISNSQFRHFLLVPSSSIASKMLRSLKLQESGSFKKRKYFLAFPE